MLRAARVAQDRGVELRAVEMPEGTDPADILAAGGAEAFATAAGRRARNDPVSGTPGSCRCRSRYAHRQGQSSRGGARLDRCHTRTDGYARRTGPRGGGSSRRARRVRAQPRCRVAACAAPPSALAGRRLGGRGRVPRGARVPGALPGQRRARSALPVAADRRAALVRRRCCTRASSPPRRTSTTRSPALQRTTRRWERSSATWSTPRRSSPRSPSRSCA